MISWCLSRRLGEFECFAVVAVGVVELAVPEKKQGAGYRLLCPLGEECAAAHERSTRGDRDTAHEKLVASPGWWPVS